MFFQAGGMALILWGRAKLAADSGVEDIGPGAVALAQNVRTRAEVDATLADAAAYAKEAGARQQGPAPTKFRAAGIAARDDRAARRPP